MKRATNSTSLSIEILEDRLCLSGGPPCQHGPPPQPVHHDSQPFHEGGHQDGHHGEPGPDFSAPPIGNRPLQQNAPIVQQANNGHPINTPRDNVRAPAVLEQSTPPPPLVNVPGRPLKQAVQPPPAVNGNAVADFFARETPVMPADAGAKIASRPPVQPMVFQPALSPMALMPPPVHAAAPPPATLPEVSGPIRLLPHSHRENRSDEADVGDVRQPALDRAASALLTADEIMLSESIEQLAALVDRIWHAQPLSPVALTWIGAVTGCSLVVLAGGGLWLQYYHAMRKSRLALGDRIDWPDDEPRPWEAP